MVVQCNDYSSCAEILDEIRGGLALYDDRIVAREVKRARAAKSNIADGVVIPIATAIETAVLSHQYDAESMLGRDKTNPCLVIIFNSSEKMPASVFGTLLESLADVVSVRLFFVMDHSSACPLPTLVEGGQRCRFDAELAEVPSTLELADSVMLSLLSTHILPVYLPRSVLTTLHLAFDDGDRCVYWLVSR